MRHGKKKKPYERLEGKTIQFEQEIEDTGKIATVKVDAAMLLRDYDKRIAALQDLVKACG